MVNTVGIIGHGNFGKFLLELGQRFFPEVEFRVHSRRHEPDGKNFFDLKTAAQSDVVILCDGISEYEERMLAVLEHALPETVLIDVATVKKHTSELCHKHCDGRRFISTHPMFGPVSYKKHKGDVSGFRIVVTDYALKNDMYQMLKQKFADFGFNIIEMTADEHDKRLAETLFLTHYIGQSIVRAGFNRTEIDTLSFQFLMDAVESVKDDMKLFEDVYRFNPYCKNVAERLHDAQESVYKELQ
ncbi:MAG: prephenate dehydrogenase/arogenate dehydrogenase family protein [Candidatus Kaiserbacteria bacterium]|nr:prephenate dehydrogenase/arogenate dehydrogenase family protein [Candidatus Kaiserbacteria bacterium]MCB9816334.1 prephenate dehydrogenase/arogenate dehydrogenase family protein [Candidatus Nomurabacteria bacterium]